MDADRAPIRSGVEVRRAAAAFAQPIRGRGVLRLLTSFGPFVSACAAMYLVYPISALLALALAVPTALLLVRVFVVQHDCSHGTRFASRRANAIVGRLCSPATMTCFANWARQHSRHHADRCHLVHVRHLNPRAPNDRLGPAHEAVRVSWPVNPLGFPGGFRAPWLTPRDEDRSRLVSFAAARSNA